MKGNYYNYKENQENERIVIQSYSTSAYRFHQIHIISISYSHLIIDCTKQASISTFYHFQHLGVINKFNMCKWNTFTLINCFFFFKSGLVKQLLQSFICIINTKLLKAIVLENFKAEDI